MAKIKANIIIFNQRISRAAKNQKLETVAVS